jgi:hypothetical protein
LDISDAILRTANIFLTDLFRTYIDEDRQLKTLLNYGEDRQSLVVAQKLSTAPRSMLLKLLHPVPSSVQINDRVFISREVAKSVVDKFRVKFAPEIDNSPYLRPKNTKVKVDSVGRGTLVKRATLSTLGLLSGSAGVTDAAKNISFEDKIARQWYSYDFNSSELNLDFTSYKNFVFYSSALLRLYAFREKLLKIEELDRLRIQFTGSTFTGSVASAGAVYLQEESSKRAKEIEEIVRNFDRYEQHLYHTPYATQSPYSASNEYKLGPAEYNPISYWPKDSNNQLYSVESTTATQWFTTQSAIAYRYDQANPNNLVNTIPEHIKENPESLAYVTFVNMTGHMFDIVKPYVDHMPYIHSRYLDPNKELSKDLINEVAESMGFKLPAINTIYNISDNVLGTESSTPRRDFTTETYKRLLHNLPVFAKAKGTKSAVDVLLRSLGISPQFLSVKESGTPVTSSYNIYEEYSTGLDFDQSVRSYVKVPFSASLRSPKAMQFNVLLPTEKRGTLLTGDDKWVLEVIPHPTIPKYGRLFFRSGSLTEIVTDFDPIFSEELINITIQKRDDGFVSLQTIATENDTTLFNKTYSSLSPLESLWNSTEYVYLGGSGSAVTENLEGTFDEFRLWGINLSQRVVENNAFDPGSNAADEYTDASNYLYTQISFNSIVNDLLTGSAPNYIINESPYANISQSPSLQYLEVYNVTTESLSRYNRTIRQIGVAIGPSTYVTKKVNILPPPVFTDTSLSSDGAKKLSRINSIVSSDKKKLNQAKNEVLVALSPTEFINQNIARSIGLENINNVLGLPSSTYLSNRTLESIKRHYNQYYYSQVNLNQFIRLMGTVSSLLDEILDYFIPSRATLLKGIVIEPNVLERLTIPAIKDLRFYGSKAKRTLNAPGSLSGSNADYGATFNLTKTIKLQDIRQPSGSNLTQQGIIDTREVTDLTARNTSYKTNLSGVTGSISGSNYSYKGQAEYSISITGSNSTFKSRIQYTPSASAKSNNLTVTIERPVNMEQPVHLTGSRSTVSTVTTTVSSSVLIISSSYNSYLYQHEVADNTNPYYTDVNKPKRYSRIDTNIRNVKKIKFNSTNKGSAGAEPFNRVYTRKLFDYEIQSLRPGGTGSIYAPALTEIKPSVDFTIVGSYTYFNDPDGIYRFPTTIKEPVFPVPINFEAATSWSYGARYNIYDVVEQNVTNDDVNLINAFSTREEAVKLIKNAQAGNKKYYVFTTRPVYKEPSDDVAFYSGSVPSYTPPSLDRVNWQLLKFRPVEVRQPRKIVFDTFTVSDPALNNYKTTTVSVDRIIDVPSRYVDSFNITTILPNSYVIGKALLQNIAAMFAIQSSNGGVRVRLYRTAEARDADISRASEVQPLGSHGVLLDTVINVENTPQFINPITSLVAGQVPPNGEVFYTVNNLSTTNGKSNTRISIYYFAMQIESRIPTGYLPIHYRFFRDNSTATKRRNYEGCKFKITGYSAEGNPIYDTIDGSPPVEVKLAEGTDLTISKTLLNAGISVGGGGTLNA